MRRVLFLQHKLDGTNRVEMAGEIRFYAQRVLAHFVGRSVLAGAQAKPIAGG
jgi:hypothetical protein